MLSKVQINYAKIEAIAVAVLNEVPSSMKVECQNNQVQYTKVRLQVTHQQKSNKLLTQLTYFLSHSLFLSSVLF